MGILRRGRRGEGTSHSYTADSIKPKFRTFEKLSNL